MANGKKTVKFSYTVSDEEAFNDVKNWLTAVLAQAGITPMAFKLPAFEAWIIEIGALLDKTTLRFYNNTLEIIPERIFSKHQVDGVANTLENNLDNVVKFKYTRMG